MFTVYKTSKERQASSKMATATSGPSAAGVLSERTKEQSLEFRSKSVEQALAPLIEQVTNLSGLMESQRRVGRSRKASRLVQIIEKATRNFIAVGEQLSNENPEFQEELVLACDEVRAAGVTMHKAASEFAQDTSVRGRREAMTKASRELLSSVIRLMVVADAVDISKLIKASGRIEDKLWGLRDARDVDDLIGRIRDCAPDISNITQLATLRQNGLKSEASQQLLAIAQLQLNQASKMLICSSKCLLLIPRAIGMRREDYWNEEGELLEHMAFLQHRDLKWAEENRDYVITGMLEALKTIALLADGEDPDSIEYGMGPIQPGEVVTNFKKFQTALDKTATAAAMATPSSPSLQEKGVGLQQRLEKILGAASQLAGSFSTRDCRQHSIITCCGKLKGQMQGLVAALAEVGDSGDKRKVIGEHVTEIRRETDGLWKEFCRAMIDHVSDTFMDTASPMNVMCEAAQAGDSPLTEKRVEPFTKHARKLEMVALLACSLSENVEGIRLVKVAAKHVRTLRPQMVNVARMLASYPNSHVAQKSIAVFKEAWVENVSLLTNCVDAITPLQDFMAVTEEHIRQDSQQFLQAVDKCDSPSLRRCVSRIKGRCQRLTEVVRDNTEEDSSTEQGQQIEMAIQRLTDKSLPWFCKLASKAADTLQTTKDPKKVNTMALEEGAQKVNDDVRNIRRSVLFTMNPSELEEESDMEDLVRPPRPITPTPSLLSQISTGSDMATGSPKKFMRTPTHSHVFDEKDTTRVVMAQLPAEQQAKLAKVAEGLSAEQAKLESEAQKWGDGKSDIIILAKEMCIMMMDMSDFTRGQGPLRTTMDVIVTAKDIARAGENLDELARGIAEECPDKQCQKDIIAYLERIQLYCHQLKITSAVKADLKTSIRETVDNASALITAAKNLMKAVVSTVKTCFVASNSIRRVSGSVPPQVLQWKLAAPKKKRLFASLSGSDASLHRSSSQAPIHQLGEFKLEWDTAAGDPSAAAGGAGGVQTGTLKDFV